MAKRRHRKLKAQYLDSTLSLFDPFHDDSGWEIEYNGSSWDVFDWGLLSTTPSLLKTNLTLDEALDYVDTLT